MQAESEDRRPLWPVGMSRQAAYAVLAVLALGSSTVRILNVSKNEDSKTPFLSANDRSRWCTIQAIVNDGTYVIDDAAALPGWDTIDKVQHDGRDGQPHFYSSKPPLMPTLLAAKVWLVQRITGTELASRPFLVGRLTLLLTNLPLLLICIAVAISFAERWGVTDWGRIYTVAVASLATFLTTFSITLNNHLPAAAGAAVSLWAVDAIWQRGFRQPWWFLLAGFATAWTAANELPALSFLALVTAILFYLDPKRTVLFFLPAVALVAAAFFLTNYIAHASWIPPYAHSDWYDYPGTHWSEAARQGLDRGEPSRVVYALHTLLGHHGVFSLTPVWLLSLVGLVLMVRQGRTEWAAMIVVLTLT